MIDVVSPARARSEDARIRVLFVMIQMAMGGSERLILNLVRNLDRRVFEPSVAWFEQEQPLDEFSALDVPLHYVPKQPGFDWRVARRLSRIIREQRIDVVNAHHFMPFFYAWYGAKVGNRAGLVYTEHAEADVVAVNGKWQAIGRWLLQRSDAAVGVSDRVSAALTSHFRLDPGAVHTIENGVDVDLFTEDQPRRAQLRSDLGFSHDHVVIGHVANFRRNKNHVFLLRAFRELVARRPEARLVLAGKGIAGDSENSEPDVLRFIESNGLSESVRVLGYRANVQELLGVLDVFCLVSYREGMPLSLIEAMAAGLPAIGTDVAGIRDVIKPDGNGQLVPPDDVPALAAALERLIDDGALRRDMGRTARQLAVEKYSLKRCVHETQRAFISLVPDRPSAERVGHSTVA